MSRPATQRRPAVADEIFQTIRGQEVNFPFPVPKKTVTIGTFDAATGKFSYSVPKYTETVENDLPGKPPIKLTGGKVDGINAVEVVLRFQIKNRTGEVVVTIPGIPVVRSSADTITVSIGGAASVIFTISHGGKKFKSELPLEITRVLVGAGVFELPALPVAIIYAPPVDQAKRNVSKWTVAQSTGNTTTFSVGTDNTTSHPVTPDFDNVNLISSEMKGVAKALDLLNKSLKNPAVEGISKGLSIISDALGTSTASESEGLSVNSQHSLTLSIAKQQTISTNPASGGPGSGDLIYFLKNVKLVWFAQSVGRVRVSVIGHDGIGFASAGFLKEGGSTDLDAQTVAEFLKLDPFVAGGSSAALPKDRYQLLETIDLNGGDIQLVETYAITTSDLNQQTSTRTHIQNHKPGFLKFLGIGVTDENSTVATTRHTSATQTTSTRSVSNAIQLFAGPDERYAVELYCDVVFGTFAYRLAGAAPRPILTGVVRKDSKAVARQLVRITIKGNRFVTRTDAKGQYEFRAPTIKPGPFEIAAAGFQKSGTLVVGTNTFNLGN